jgi:hypothetical protein
VRQCGRPHFAAPTICATFSSPPPEKRFTSSVGDHYRVGTEMTLTRSGYRRPASPRILWRRFLTSTSNLRASMKAPLARR